MVRLVLVTIIYTLLISALGCTNAAPLAPAKFKQGDMVQTALGKVPVQILSDLGGSDLRRYYVRIMTPTGVTTEVLQEFELEPLN